MDYHRPLSAAESRRMSLTAGIMWLITFATSIPALWLFQPVLDDPAGYVAGAGDDNRIFFLELLLIISALATAVIHYPLLKRQGAPAAEPFSHDRSPVRPHRASHRPHAGRRACQAPSSR
jgi:hypothetical protein